jgi:hypothetical protein
MLATVGLPVSSTRVGNTTGTAITWLVLPSGLLTVPTVTGTPSMLTGTGGGGTGTGSSSMLYSLGLLATGL